MPKHYSHIQGWRSGAGWKGSLRRRSHSTPANLSRTVGIRSSSLLSQLHSDMARSARPRHKELLAVLREHGLAHVTQVPQNAALPVPPVMAEMNVKYPGAPREWFSGMGAPAFRASLNAMATACLRLVTGPPFPSGPDFSSPSLNSASSGKFVGDGERQRAVAVRKRRNLRQVESNDFC